MENEAGTRVINGNQYKTVIEDIDIMKLKFYVENPRVYSALNNNEGVSPSQEQIFNVMRQLESVKDLKENIENNGGLTDPIIVQGGKYIVLEGNSRLAAYRLLYLKSGDDPEQKKKWEKIRCEVFPESISEKDIFTLLGQYHVAGKTNWDPYEQANYLYRWNKNSRMPVEEMSKRLGIKPSEAKKMIKVIQFMKKYNDNDIHHYSHYYEYIAHKDLEKYREDNPELDDRIATGIQSGTINEAKDLRKLKNIATEALKKHNRTATKQLESIKEGATSIYAAYDVVESTGAFDSAYKKLKAFRETIAANDFESQLSQTDNDRVKYELKNTIRLLNKIAKHYGITNNGKDTQ